jgi:hypothetical protein
MCDNCKEVLGVNTKSHSSKDCYLAKATYCTVCSNYGHTYTTCSYNNCGPEYLEQLIIPKLIEEYNIHTNTPIKKSKTHGIYNNENIQYIEDLIKERLILKYSISSYTPLDISLKQSKATTPVIDVLDNPKAIRDLLKAYNYLPDKQDRRKDKYKIRLEEYAKKNKYIIEYHSIVEHE